MMSWSFSLSPSSTRQIRTFSMGLVAGAAIFALYSGEEGGLRGSWLMPRFKSSSGIGGGGHSAANATTADTTAEAMRTWAGTVTSKTKRNNNDKKSTAATTATTTATARSSELLPPVMRALRLLLEDPQQRSELPADVEQVYRSIGRRRYPSSGECSCRNPQNSDPQCCIRFMRRNHKFGFELVSSLLYPKKNQNAHGFVRSPDGMTLLGPNVTTNSNPGSGNYLSDQRFSSADADFRAVMVIRNIYRACVSGYLYHRYVLGCPSSLFCNNANVLLVHAICNKNGNGTTF